MSKVKSESFIPAAKWNRLCLLYFIYLANSHKRTKQINQKNWNKIVVLHEKKCRSNDVVIGYNMFVYLYILMVLQQIKRLVLLNFKDLQNNFSQADRFQLKWADKPFECRKRLLQDHKNNFSSGKDTCLGLILHIVPLCNYGPFKSTNAVYRRNSFELKLQSAVRRKKKKSEERLF